MWHQTDMPTDAGNVCFLGYFGSPVSGPSGPVLTRSSYQGECGALPFTLQMKTAWLSLFFLPATMHPCGFDWNSKMPFALVVPDRHSVPGFFPGLITKREAPPCKT